MSTKQTQPVVPDGYMQDAQGRLVPESLVRPIDKLRDQTVRNIVSQAQDLAAVIAKFKAVAFSDIAAMLETSAEQYGAKVRSEKGHLTLYSYDGRYKIQRAVAEFIRFDERLQVAKSLIDECITAWSNGSRDEIKLLVNDAFRVNQEGNVRASVVLGLRRFDIKDEKWLQAMQAITDAVQVVGSKTYLRIYERIGDTDKYRQVALDIASS